MTVDAEDAACRPGVFLIASQKSRFKESVIEGVVERLGGEDMMIHIRGLDYITGEIEDYDAILLINTCMAWSTDPRVRRFLDGNPQLHPRTVVFTTSGDGGWVPRLEKRGWAVEAVSGASEDGTVEQKAGELTKALVGVSQRE
jgi:hypothetical protein